MLSPSSRSVSPASRGGGPRGLTKAQDTGEIRLQNGTTWRRSRLPRRSQTFGGGSKDPAQTQLAWQVQAPAMSEQTEKREAG